VESAKGKTREETINRLADRIDNFERYTQPHSRLIAELATRLARRFGLGTPDIEAISEAAMLHDVGLAAMAPSYYSLQGPLSFESRLDLWRHPVVGEQQMAKRQAMRHPQLLVRWHHEWWNGSGYPDMLAFEDIPIGARILRAVDLYCALLSDRPYRAALDEKQAVETFSSSAGIECDPYVVRALLALLDELYAEKEPEALTLVESPAAPPEPERPQAFEQPVFELFTAEATPPALTVPSVAPASDVNTFNESGDFQLIAPETSEQHEPPPIELLVEPSAVEAPPPTLPISPTRPSLPPLERLLSRAQSSELDGSDSTQWRGWSGSHYNKKTLLGFEASVLRQIESRSIAIPFWGEARLDWYLKAWGKLIFANDPRALGATLARAAVEGVEPLREDVITQILEDVYIPGARLTNPGLRHWFGETDAWWMDNLRRNIDQLSDELMRAQALTLGVQTGDYALSFDEETRELRRPLTTVFWRLAGRAFAGPAGHPHNRSFNQPAEEFIKHARADLLFLNLPSSHADRGGSESRSEWREAWVTGDASAESDQAARRALVPQSKQSYLATINRLLRHASQFRTWAIEYQEPGIATAPDIVELIKEYRPVRATYSKDVTEVAGGLRSYIIVGERPPGR
jgi:HD domain-containing protein